MHLSPTELRSIPLLREMTDRQLRQLADVFEQINLEEGQTLFEAGDLAQTFHLLVEGEITIYEGDVERYVLSPPAPIGELGALAGLTRNTTAVAHTKARLWAVGREPLLRFFESNNTVALIFYQSLLHLIADKVWRDQIRMDDMRRNIIRTQKAMKKMRDFLLESDDTPVSEPLHNQLEQQIRNNRRANYRVRPPETLPATVKIGAGQKAEVVEISRTHVSFVLDQDPLPSVGGTWSGVLQLGGPEIPISGIVLRTLNRRVDLELDLLIDEYGSALDGYLTRVQMLDFMV